MLKIRHLPPYPYLQPLVVIFVTIVISICLYFKPAIIFKYFLMMLLVCGIRS
jgi:hypothetical protein